MAGLVAEDPAGQRAGEGCSGSRRRRDKKHRQDLESGVADFRAGARRLARRLVLALRRVRCLQGPRGVRAVAHRPGRAHAPGAAGHRPRHPHRRRRLAPRDGGPARRRPGRPQLRRHGGHRRGRPRRRAHRAPGLPRRLRAGERQVPARLRGARARGAHARGGREHRQRHAAAAFAMGPDEARAHRLREAARGAPSLSDDGAADPASTGTRISCRRPSSTARRPPPARSTSSPRSTATTRPGGSSSCRPGTTR